MAAAQAAAVIRQAIGLRQGRRGRSDQDPAVPRGYAGAAELCALLTLRTSHHHKGIHGSGGDTTARDGRSRLVLLEVSVVYAELVLIPTAIASTVPTVADH